MTVFNLRFGFLALHAKPRTWLLCVGSPVFPLVATMRSSPPAVLFDSRAGCECDQAKQLLLADDLFDCLSVAQII